MANSTRRKFMRPAAAIAGSSALAGFTGCSATRQAHARGRLFTGHNWQGGFTSDCFFEPDQL